MRIRALNRHRLMPSLAAALAAFCIATPAAAVTVDQSNLVDTGNPFSSLVVDSNTGLRAQGFTVGTAGFLTGVRTQIAFNVGSFATDPNEELTVGIYDVDAGGAVDIGGGALLSATTMPMLTSTDIFDVTLYQTDFVGSLEVDVGDTLAIVLSVDATQNKGIFWAQSGGYAGGVRYDTNPVTGVLGPVATQDFGFETLISPPSVIPLPAGALLLLGGFGVAAAVRGLRRS